MIIDPPVELPVDDPAAWTRMSVEEAFSLPRSRVEPLQLEVMRRRFAELKGKVDALNALAENQNVSEIRSIDDVVPILFDHKVYKSYPLSLIEKRNFKRLNTWLNRLTTHDLTNIDLDGVNSVDAWLTRLDENGMIVGHSTGTTGKLSFIPRSQTEWPAWAAAYFLAMTAATGIDQRKERVTSLSASYRSGHQMMVKMGRLMAGASAEGEEGRNMLYDYAISSDLLSLAGRVQAAEAAGELDSLEIDPKIIDEHKRHIEAAKHRDRDLEVWFAQLAEKHRGERVMVGGPSADLVRIALRGIEKGITCEFAPNSLLMTGGGFKGFKGAPDNWQELLMEFFGIPRVCSVYGMSETMTTCPKCSEGHYHVPAYLLPILLNENAEPLPREGAQTGRFAFFDLLAETYWGGFISGDQVTIYWDEDCACGWKGPRLGPDIKRFSEMEGGDDKITCAGTQQAYNNFMDYVSGV
jgi:hypothetical protein